MNAPLLVIVRQSQRTAVACGCRVLALSLIFRTARIFSSRRCHLLYACIMFSAYVSPFDHAFLENGCVVSKTDFVCPTRCIMACPKRSTRRESSGLKAVQMRTMAVMRTFPTFLTQRQQSLSNSKTSYCSPLFQHTRPKLQIHTFCLGTKSA